MTKIIELIYTEVTLGDGTKKDPYRECIQLWTKDGLLVADSSSVHKTDAEEWEAVPVFIPENVPR
jgi:hypothetical protein